MQKLILLLCFLFPSIFLFGQWTKLHDVPFINHHTNGFGLNGKAYVVQGQSETINGQSGNMMWEYDPLSDSWTEKGLTPARSRGFAIGDDMNGKYYFGFGTDRNDVWEYDPITNEYKELPTCPCEGRGHPAFVAHNNKIFMGAGSGNNGDLKDWWIFDFATQTWEQKEDMLGERRHHPYQFGIDDAIYVGGGHRGNWLKWDIINETWSAIDDFPGGRVAGTQFSHKGKGFILSGDKVDHTALEENSFLMYDPGTDQWIDLPFEREMHRWACSSFIIDDFLYYFGGIGYVDGGSDEPMFKFDISTVSCLAPIRIFTTDITESSAGLFWSESISGEIDHFQWREEGAEWLTVETTESLNTINDLSPCTNYEFRVHTNCGDDGDSYSQVVPFRTIGCGVCLDKTFCELTSFESQNAFLESVSINDYTNQSGDNEGYEEFTNSSEVEVSIGGSFELMINPNISGSAQNYRTKVFMDFDGDSEFSDEELLLDETAAVGAALERVVDIPLSAVIGLSRIRIIFSLNPIFGPCSSSSSQEGEVEDYCVTIVDELTRVKSLEEVVNSLVVFPNPIQDNLKINLSGFENIGTVSLENIHGVSLLSNRINKQDQTELVLSTAQIPNGIYIIRVSTMNGEQIAVKKIVKN